MLLYVASKKGDDYMNKNVNGLKLFMLEYINETGNCDYSSNPKAFIQDFFNWFTENKSLSENSFYKYSVYNNEFSKKIYLDLMIQLGELSTLTDEELVKRLDELLLVLKTKTVKIR